jgi:serine O-acetyltransferase
MGKILKTLELDTHRKGLRLIARILFNLNYHAVFLIRIVTDGKSAFWAKRAKNRLQKRYGIVVHRTNVIGKPVRIGHPWGIILGEDVVIGDNCTIMQDVTIGKKHVLDKDEGYPVIGNDVIIGAGAKIIGEIKIGDGGVIGANAVVTCDTENNSTYAGIPARRLK